MKRTLFISNLIVFIILLVGCNSQKDYKLQEQCGKQSKEWFKEKYGSEDRTLYYESHYNKTMKKCFIVVTEDKINKLYKNPYYRKSLWDINENKEYGFAILTEIETACFLNGSNKKCKYTVEWDELIKPYMTE